MKPIKLQIITHPTSVTRGIGYYETNLKASLEKLPEIQITDHFPDLVHYTFFDLFYPTLTIKPLPVIVTVHDVTPLVLDKLYPKGIKGRINLFRQKLRLKKAAAIITDSQNSKKDIQKYLKIPSSKIFTIPLAADPLYSSPVSSQTLEEIKQQYRLPDHFVLYVGGVNPNKNLIRLVEATQNLSLPLVLVGSEFTKNPPSNQSIHPELKQFVHLRQLIETSSSILTPGYVSAPDLSAIYRLATVHCQPSLYEGFGLPLLEAMSAGCPVVSSNTSSLPELLYPDAITFDPYSTQSITSALQKILSLSAKDRKRLVILGQQQAKNFTWEKTALNTQAVYKQVCRHD